MSRVRDAMHEGLITCSPGAPLGEVAAALVRDRVHALVVVEDDGSPVGVVADSDLLAGEWLATDSESLATLRELTAGELMSSPVETIEADAPLDEARRRLASGGVSRLIVIDKGRAAGVVTVSDLVSRCARLPEKRGRVADVMSRGLVVCRTGSLIGDVARAMTERHSRSIVVLDSGGRACGVVTGRDLIDAAERATVDELMKPPQTIRPYASLREAADEMLRLEIHRLVVVDDVGGTPLGLISTMDIVAEMAGAQSVWRDEDPLRR